MQYLIYLHAFLGGIALLAGLIAAFTIKGSKIHKKTGAAFHHTMVASIILSMIIAASPERHNPFLLAIGIFSLYAVVSGRRCLKTKKPQFNYNIDRIMAILFTINGLLMIFLPLIIQKELNIILTVFGVMSVLGGIRDFILLKNPEQYKADRIKLHINKISGGYIAAVTAFLVVNQLLPGYWAWFTPTVIGSVYATYYNLKERKKIINS